MKDTTGVNYTTTMLIMMASYNNVHFINLNLKMQLIHLSGLTGLNKAETAAKHGEEQVKIWRRSFDTPPPPMDLIHPYYNIIVNDARYVDNILAEL